MKKDIAVIFDMDGVLVDNSKYHDQAWQIMCKKYGKNVTIEELKNIFGGTNKAYAAKLLNVYDEKKVKAIAIEKEALYRQIFEKYISAPEGLQELLDDLKKNKAYLAVATSGIKENLDYVVDKLKIRHYFKALINETYVKNGKPDPEIYLTTAKIMGLEPKQCIAIEDTNFGIQAALGAGMKVIGITSSFDAQSLKNASLIINKFSDIDYKKIRQIIETV